MPRSRSCLVMPGAYGLTLREVQALFRLARASPAEPAGTLASQRAGGAGLRPAMLACARHVMNLRAHPCRGVPKAFICGRCGRADGENSARSCHFRRSPPRDERPCCWYSRDHVDASSRSSGTLVRTERVAVAARMTPANATAVLNPNAQAKPAVPAMWVTRIVRIAIPRALETYWADVRTAPAAPLSSPGTPVLPSTNTDVKTIPWPRPLIRKPGSRPIQYDSTSSMPASMSSPAAETVKPTRSTRGAVHTFSSRPATI